MIMGLVGQEGAAIYVQDGISKIFLDILNAPSEIILIFIIISVLGTLFITMYIVIRLTGAMSDEGDFFLSNYLKRKNKKRKTKLGTKFYLIELPKIALISQIIVYLVFFMLIYIESNYFGTNFVLYCVYYLGILGILLVLFFISLTNFKAHRMNLQKEKIRFRLIKTWIYPLFSMLFILGIIILQIFLMWTQPDFPLPGPADSKAYLFWQWFGRLFPFLIIVPGLLYWFFSSNGKKKGTT